MNIAWGSQSSSCQVYRAARISLDNCEFLTSNETKNILPTDILRIFTEDLSDAKYSLNAKTIFQKFSYCLNMTEKKMVLNF